MVMVVIIMEQIRVDIMWKNNSKQTYIIAEIGQAHEGSLGILHSYIDALADTGIDAVKFQTHIAAAESSKAEPFRINFSYEDKTRYDYWHRMSFTAEQWIGIKAHCEEKKLDFISSPFSLAAVDLLEAINTQTYKIGSGEVSNFLMLEKICQTGKPIILSSGMNSYAEIAASIEFIQKHGNDLAVMQCTTQYPTDADRIGFNVIGELINKYPTLTIGLSEHTGKIATGIAAVALGARILEFHAVFDRRMFGPDSSSSLTIDEIKSLVDSIRFIEKGLQASVDKNDLQPFEELKKIFEKSLAVNKDLKAGTTIAFEDLEAKKPADQGISAREFRTVIGKKLKVDKRQYDFLTEADIIA